MVVCNNFLKLQQIQFNLFKSQNPEIGKYDVVFEFNEKKLYAYRNMLIVISDTFDRMLSDQWTSKNEPIQIKDYSYEEFYQFLTFLYSGQCQLTDDNIYSMTDIAEFYNVSIFKTFCDEYLANMKFTVENVSKILELAIKYSLIQLKNAAQNYIVDNFSSFVDSEAVMELDKFVFKELVVTVKEKVKPEELFQVVFQWSKKQAIEKRKKVLITWSVTQDPTIDQNFNENDAIKSEITEFLPHIYFDKMDLSFLHEFVVPNGFVFSSFNEISKMLRDSYAREKSRSAGIPETMVKVTNSDGQVLQGRLISDKDVLENIKITNLSNFDMFNDKPTWWKPKFKIPSSPSPIKKKEGVKWYLFFNIYGQIGIQHSCHMDDKDYLIAEMMPVNGNEFRATQNCKIEIV